MLIIPPQFNYREIVARTSTHLLQVRPALSRHSVFRLSLPAAAALHLPDHHPLLRAMGLQDPEGARPQDVGQGDEGPQGDAGRDGVQESHLRFH